MPNNPSILILTSGSPASNPRMVKEATELNKRGYDVHVLYGFIASWSDKLDGAILHDAKWTASRVGGHPVDDRLPWIISRFLHKSAELFQMRGIFKFTYSRLSLPLLIRGFRQKPDAIIAHNLGALPPAYLISKWKSIPMFFDAEDFHSGESYNDTENSINRAAEERFIRHCNGISTASPLIGEAYKHIFPNLKIFTVNNCFSIEDQRPLIPIHNSHLRFAWFSQTIGNDRGLMEFLIAVADIKNQTAIHITLIGQCSDEFSATLKQSIQKASHITLDVRPPMPESEIMKVLRESHLGLALERTQPLNRDLCLTNKVFSYLLNGCQILYSNTRAQKKFQNEHPTSGRLIELDNKASIQNGVEWYLNHFSTLEDMRQKNWELSRQKLHFEREAAPWFEFIESHLAE